MLMKRYNNNIIIMKQFRGTHYNVYEDGRIHNTITNRWLTGSIVQFPKNNSKRVYIGLCINNKQKHMFLHRILAECFIPNPNNLPFVNHIDGNPLNNALSNLEWCTCSDNNKHAIATGLRPTKINKEIADIIRYKLSNGTKAREIKLEYRIGLTQISRIRNLQAWI